MVLGTHNSCTSYSLKGWSKLLYPLAWLTARCQSKNLEEQWNAGVRYYNLQVAYHDGDWYLSHGLVLYDITLHEALVTLSVLSKGEKVYVELILDNNFWLKEEVSRFETLVNDTLVRYDNIFLVRSIVEKTWTVKQYYYNLNLQEHYWTMTWAKDKPWWYKLPVPCLWARLFNKQWMEEYKDKCDVLMMDFV